MNIIFKTMTATTPTTTTTTMPWCSRSRNLLLLSRNRRLRTLPAPLMWTTPRMQRRTTPAAGRFARMTLSRRRQAATTNARYGTGGAGKGGDGGEVGEVGGWTDVMTSARGRHVGTLSHTPNITSHNHITSHHITSHRIQNTSHHTTSHHTSHRHRRAHRGKVGPREVVGVDQEPCLAVGAGQGQPFR